MSLPYIFLSISLASFLVGIVVFKDRPRRLANQAFCVFAFGTSLWIGSFGLLLLTEARGYIFSLNIGGLLLVAGLTWFSIVFPNKTLLPVHPLLFFAPLVVGGVAMILSDTVVAQVTVLPDFTTKVIHGPLICIWGTVLLTYIVLSLIFFVKSYRYAKQEDQIRLRYVYIGIALFTLCSVTFDVVLPGFFGQTNFNSIGPLSAFIFLLATAYAIRRHEFLDIRVIVQRGFIYTCAFFLFGSIYIIGLLCIERLTEHMAGIAAPFSAALTILIGFYTLPRIETGFRKITDPWFFKERYDYFAILDSLGLVVNESVSLRPMVIRSLTILDSALKPSYGYFLQVSSNYYYFTRDVSLSDLQRVSSGKQELRVPICANSRMIGEYVFGRKRSGENYSSEDYSLLRTFAAHAQVGFEKAELYQQLQEYSSQLETTVDQRTQNIRELQKRERELFDDLSHALQTPLTVLKSGFELLRTAPSKDPSPIRKTMQISVDDLSRLVRSMLRLARVSSEPIVHASSRFNLSELVAKVQEYACVTAQAKDISLEASVETDLFVSGDYQQLEEALANVIGNAVKYTTGCNVRTVSVRLYSDELKAHMTISDSGVGMSSSDVQHAFERFYRSRPETDGHMSTGLGLAISKRIVERHNGTISLSSILGAGTIVKITIPLAPQEVPFP